MFKNYVIKNITHSILSDRRCILRYHARRFECPVCKKTYYERNLFVFKVVKIFPLTVYNILDDLKKYNEIFSLIAKRYYISSTTVASIFDSSKYVCVLLDFKNQTPIDVLLLEDMILFFHTL